jgi:tetratricopeptide (TPR) repeat protein/capsular polysaccharide biosynthesis protein
MSIQQGLQQVQNAINQGDLNQALEMCQKLLFQSPGCAAASILMGSIYEQQKEYGWAMEAYREAIKHQPNSAEAYVYLAQLYRDVGWINEAAAYYQKALKLRWNWPELHDYFGLVLYQQGDIKAAIQHHQEAIKQNPNYVNAYLNLAVRLNYQGRTKQVIKLLEITIKRFPNCAKAYYNLGCLLLQENQAKSAVRLLQTSVQLDPNFALGYNSLGQAWMVLDNPTAAIFAYQQAIKINPKLTTAYQNLGKVWQQKNQQNKAVFYFYKALQIYPDNLLIYGDCAYSLMAQGQLDQALICLQTAITIEPKWVNAFCQRFASLSLADHQQDQLLCSQIACAHFLQSLQQFDLTTSHSQIDRQLAQIYFYTGNTLVEYGQIESAVFYYQKSIQIQPDDIPSYLKLAHCYAHQNRWNAVYTICCFAKNIPNLPQNFKTEINFMLGCCCEQQHHYPSAIKYYHKALQSQKKTNNCLIPEEQFSIHWKITSEKDNNLEQNLPENIILSTLEWHKKNLLADSYYFPINSVQFNQKYAESESDSDTCAGLECSACVHNIFQQLELINLGNNIQTRSKNKHLFCPSLPQFVAIIPQGRAWITPQINYWNVCKAIAIITPNNQLLADVSRDYPGQLPGCSRYHPKQHQIFQQNQLPPLQKFEGSVAVLSGLSGHIYFHWMVDILPRIELLRRSGINLSQIDYFLVNSAHLPFQRETLQQLGIPADKILESDQFPHLQATQLIVPSFAGYLGWLEPWAIYFLRKTFLTLEIQAKSGYPKRIYISRKNARHRRVLNETEVMEELSNYGFVSVELETLSFGDQVALFSQAQAIIAPHGSGLTNIIFCQKSAKIAEFISPHYNRHYYWVISQSLGLEHYSLTGEAFPCYPLRNLMYQNPLTEDIWVNLTDLKKLIEVMKLI